MRRKFKYEVMWHKGRGDWNNDTTTDYPRLWGKMTSYDYDAPLSEAGDTTWKYQLLRQVIGYNPLNLIIILMRRLTLLKGK